jgi:hypothetical protein
MDIILFSESFVHCYSHTRYRMSHTGRICRLKIANEEGIAYLNRHSTRLLSSCFDSVQEFKYLQYVV